MDAIPLQLEGANPAAAEQGCSAGACDVQIHAFLLSMNLDVACKNAANVYDVISVAVKNSVCRFQVCVWEQLFELFIRHDADAGSGVDFKVNRNVVYFGRYPKLVLFCVWSACCV